MLTDSQPAVRIALLNEITAACGEGRAPAFAIADLAAWGSALKDAMIHDRLDVAVHTARCLNEAFPTFTLAKRLRATFERMPLADESYLPFHDDFRKEVQVVRRDNADTTMLVFCGRAGRAGLPLCLVHRWFGRLPVSVVYLRDFRDLLYLGGIGALAPDRGNTLASLRDIVASLGTRRTLCYGNSGGVFAALHYGLDLCADKVLCLSGVTNISPRFNSRLHSAKSVGRLSGELSGAGVDLRNAYLTAARAPRSHIVYASNNWDDRLHAEYMRGLPTVTLQAVPDTANHAVIFDLVHRGQYQGLLDSFLSS
jgi:hypothetical protein